jgi:CheY-like chemotaxis protein
MTSELPAPARLSRARVLVADDDAELRLVIKSVLKKAGYSVTEAADGNRLVDLMADELLLRGGEHPFDLIISDVRMPGWTGLEVLRSLRAAGNRTPVVLITAFGDEKVHAEAASLGAATLLDKPFGLAELRAATLDAIQHRAA